LTFNESDAICRIIKEKFIFGFCRKPSRKFVHERRISLYFVLECSDWWILPDSDRANKNDPLEIFSKVYVRFQSTKVQELGIGEMQ